MTQRPGDTDTEWCSQKKKKKKKKRATPVPLSETLTFHCVLYIRVVATSIVYLTLFVLFLLYTICFCGYYYSHIWQTETRDWPVTFSFQWEQRRDIRRETDTNFNVVCCETGVPNGDSMFDVQVKRRTRKKQWWKKSGEKKEKKLLPNKKEKKERKKKEMKRRKVSKTPFTNRGDTTADTVWHRRHEPLTKF